MAAEKKGRASKTLLRMNSKAEPWNWLVPPLVTMLKAGPEVRPYSAEKLEVAILTSWMKSGPTLLISEPLEPEAWLKAPSTVRLAESERLPLMTWLLELRPVVMAEDVGVGDDRAGDEREDLGVVAAVQRQGLDLAGVDDVGEFAGGGVDLFALHGLDGDDLGGCRQPVAGSWR